MLAVGGSVTLETPMVEGPGRESLIGPPPPRAQRNAGVAVAHSATD